MKYVSYVCGVINHLKICNMKKSIKEYQEEFNQQIELINTLEYGTIEYFEAENKKDLLQQNCIIENEHLLDYESTSNQNAM